MKKQSILTAVFLMGCGAFSFAQNLNPVANNDVLVVFTNSGANTVDVQANDTDDGPFLLTTIVTAPSNGTALVLSGDSIVYTPDSNFCGMDSLVYQICDNGMPILCDQATLVITVNPKDSDGDGLNDVFETATGDFDGDGIYNFLDIDSDNDGISDLYEASVTLVCNPLPADTDGDGIPDYQDLDSDNDGMTDVVESGYGSYDTDNDGIIDNLSAVDHNANGMPDAIEASVDRDFDLDGTPDRVDLDSDNDGLGDIVESKNNLADTNGDGVVNGSDAAGGDADNDGIPDGADGFSGAGDGIGNQDEGSIDPDGDGLVNSNDLDSDNDAIGDVAESGIGALDTNSDGVIDGTDTDNDGFINIAGLDGNATFGGDAGVQTLAGQDNDGDGTVDALDLDSDNDGIGDIVESFFGAIDTNNDGVADGIEMDGDGFIDHILLDSNGTYGTNSGVQYAPGFDYDLDGSINSEDLDDDNDGIGDLTEVGFGNLDADDNGILDGTDDDGDGFINSPYVDNNLTFGCKPGIQDELSNDVDGDLYADYFDLESDGDSIPDIWEGGNGPLDTDGDFIVNGTDIDGDGVIDVAPLDTNNAFGFNSGTQQEMGIPYMNADSDGHINSEDLDSDNDGKPDAEEWDSNGDKAGNDDCDNNGIPDYLDANPCDMSMPDAFSPNGDNINDYFNIQGIGSFPNNKFSVFNRWGVVVFEAQPYTNNWGGESKVLGGIGTEILPVGTYFYVLDLGNGSTPMSGFIYLNR